MAVYTVRRIRVDDWPRLRELRLEALRDTPLAYVERYDDVVAWSDEMWQKRTNRGAWGDRSATFVACDADGTWVGMLGVYAESNGVAHIVSVYVRPAHRGRAAGPAEHLLAAGTQWAHEVGGARSLRLFVHEHNLRARRFYERMGFAETGVTTPYEPDRSTRELEMARLVDP